MGTELSPTEWNVLLQQNTDHLRLMPDSPDLWVTRARLLMLEEVPEGQDGTSGFDQVRECLDKALELSPDHLEAIEEAAHFFDAVDPDPAKASSYARRYINLTETVRSSMKEIIDSSTTNL